MPEYLTVKDAASMIRVSERTILRWIGNRSLGAVRIGHTIRFDKQRLLAELDKRQRDSFRRSGNDDPAMG